MKHNKLLSIALLGTTLFFSACNSNTATPTIPASIVFENEALYPESLSYDATKTLFYVGSLTQGTIGSVDSTGKYETFVQNEKLLSTTGILVDKQNNQLLVCNAHTGFNVQGSKENIGRVAGLAIYDLETKEEKAYHNLASLAPQEGHFANDVTVDNKNNIYITDSFSPNIYKISDKGEKEIFINNPLWDVNQGEFGLNGIVYHSKGFLIVAHYAHAKLYKVALDGSKDITEITFSQEDLNLTAKISHIDGLQLFNEHTLILVSNNLSGSDNGNAVYNLNSQDNWSTASIDKVMLTTQTSPTAVTTVGNESYLLHSQLQQLITQGTTPKSYEIEKVVFP